MNGRICVLIVAVLIASSFVVAEAQYAPRRTDKVVWQVPACSASKARGKTIGEDLSFQVPENAKVKRTSDVDYYEDWIIYQAGSKKYYFRVMVGLNIGGGADPELYKEYLTESIIERRWKSAQIKGHDVKGIGRDGTRWRSVWGFMTMADYRDASEEAARYFDRVMDSMCVQDQLQKPTPTNDERQLMPLPPRPHQ